MKRKWFFGILILVIVAVILTIVFVNLFRPRDTKALTKEFNTIAVSGYLSEDSDEYKTITEFYENSLIPNLDSDKTEVQNHLNVYKAFVEEAKFYNKEFIFSSYTNVYQKYSNKINRSFEKADSNAKAIAKYINDNEEKWNDVDFWRANGWKNIENFSKTMFENTINAFEMFGQVFVSCVNSEIINNDMTKLIFNTSADYAKEALSKSSEDTTVGQKLSSFVELYFGETGQNYVKNYIYNLTLQSKVENILEKGSSWEEDYNDFLSGNMGELV